MDDDQISDDTVSPLLSHSLEYGLASALIGATVFLAAPMVAILAAQMWAHSDRSPGIVTLYAWLARIAVVIPVLLVCGGVCLGVAGLRQASKSKSPAPLAVTGLLLNAGAMCGWCLASIGLLTATESMLCLSRQ